MAEEKVAVLVILVGAPPLVFTVFDSEFCCETRPVMVSLPNCSFAFTPKSAVEPRMSDDPVVIDTLPASIDFTMSSSFPS